MTRSIQDFQITIGRGKNSIPLFDRMSRVRNFTDTGGVTINDRFVFLKEDFVSGSMVSVFVCVENEVEIPSSFFQERIDLIRIVRIDGKGLESLRISEDVSEISKRRLSVNPKNFQKENLTDDVQMFVEICDLQDRHHVSTYIFEFEGTVSFRYVFLRIEDGSDSGRIQISVTGEVENDIGKTFSVFFDDQLFESKRVFKADAPLNSDRAGSSFCEDFCVEVFHVCFARNLFES